MQVSLTGQWERKYTCKEYENEKEERKGDRGDEKETDCDSIQLMAVSLTAM